MKFYTFEIVVEKEQEDPGYCAYSPTLPGCFSNGKTIEEARRNMQEAVQQHISSLLAHGQPVPQSKPPSPKGDGFDVRVNSTEDRAEPCRAIRRP